MIRHKICLLYKNFWSYDPVVSVPSNLPPNIDTIYVTDNLEHGSVRKKFVVGQKHMSSILI